MNEPIPTAPPNLRHPGSIKPLANALDEKQRAQAIIGTRPQSELLLGPGHDGEKIKPQGIQGSALSRRSSLTRDLLRPRHVVAVPILRLQPEQMVE